MMLRSLLIVVTLALPTLAGAQDSLDPIRELYASADYEGTLAALGRLTVDTKTDTATTLEIERYRALCLIALGRTAEADRAIESIVTMNPLYSLSPGDAAPRIRTAFADVQRRILPGLVRGWYADGKAAFDRKAFPEAVDKLSTIIAVMDNPETLASVGDLADLRTLAEGFLELSRARLHDSPEPPTAAPVAEAIRSAEPPPVAATPADSDPVALRQDFPPWIGAAGGPLFTGEYSGAVDIDIDERGAVVGAKIVDSIHPIYDNELLSAARRWLYQPARRNGQPVRAQQRVNVVLRPK
jgi:TonB family protein